MDPGPYRIKENLMKLKIFSALIVFLSLITPIRIQALTIEPGFDIWHHDYSGTIKHYGDLVEIHKDLHMGAYNNGIYFITFKPAQKDGGLPIPGITLKYYDLDDTQSTQLDRTITVDNRDFELNTTIDTRFNLSQYDIIVFFPLTYDIFSIDLGLSLKIFTGAISIDGTHAKVTGNIRGQTIPLIYLKPQLKFDEINTELFLTFQYSNYKSNNYTDAAAGFVFSTGYHVDIRLGYRYMNFDVDSSSLTHANFDVEGFFAGLAFPF